LCSKDRTDKKGIIGIYVNGDLGKKMDRIKEWMEKKENERKTIIEGISMREKKEDG